MSELTDFKDNETVLPSFTVCVRAIIIKKNALLLVREADEGIWETPGGALEPGESLIQALKREIKEEIGCEIENFNIYDLNLVYSPFQAIIVFYKVELGSKFQEAEVGTSQNWFKFRDIETMVEGDQLDWHDHQTLKKVLQEYHSQHRG